MKKVPKLILVIFIPFFVLVACAQTASTLDPVETPKSDFVVAEGHIIPNEDIKLSFSTRGKIADIFVGEGQLVKKGDLLVRQGDNEQAMALLASANMEMILAQQAYDDFVRTASISSAQAYINYQNSQVERAKAQVAWGSIDPNKIKDDIDTAETSVQDNKKLLDDANDVLNKYLDLKDDNPTRRNAEDEVRRAESNYYSAIRKVEELNRLINEPRAFLDAKRSAEAEYKRKYENTLNGTLDPEKKSLLEARLSSAKKQYLAAQSTVDNFEIHAPFTGTVTEVNVKVGELVGSEKYAIQMADTSRWYVETSDLTELEVVKVAKGQKVEIKPDALKDITLYGTVSNIGESYKSQGGDILYVVRIDVDKNDAKLRWGMTVELSFLPVSK